MLHITILIMKALYQEELLKKSMFFMNNRKEDIFTLYKDKLINVGSNSQSFKATNVSDSVY